MHYIQVATQVTEQEKFMKANKDDFYHVRKDGSVLDSKFIYDTSTSSKAHRDAIQIIPKSSKHPRWHYMGGLISNIAITNNIVIAPESKLQGIFSSDGMIKNITVLNNFIATKSDHEITLYGVINGAFRKNISAIGTPSVIRLCPLRIGGGKFGELFIMSFKQQRFNYKKVRSRDKIIDYRFEEREDYEAEYLYNFDLEAFQRDAIKVQDKDINTFIKKIKKIALNHGENK